VNPDVNAVVEDSGFSSVGEVFMARFSEVTHLPNVPWAAPLLAFGQLDVGTSLWNVGAVAKAALLDKPLLAIIGGADTIVPPAEGMAIFQAAAGPKQLLVVTDAGHVAAYSTANEKYERTVLEFLARSLQGG
jgi:fermentation-respiration switch protein FrsA (DUF1100 family)